LQGTVVKMANFCELTLFLQEFTVVEPEFWHVDHGGVEGVFMDFVHGLVVLFLVEDGELFAVGARFFQVIVPKFVAAR